MNKSDFNILFMPYSNEVLKLIRELCLFNGSSLNMLNLNSLDEDVDFRSLVEVNPKYYLKAYSGWLLSLREEFAELSNVHDNISLNLFMKNIYSILVSIPTLDNEMKDVLHRFDKVHGLSEKDKLMRRDVLNEIMWSYKYIEIIKNKQSVVNADDDEFKLAKLLSKYESNKIRAIYDWEILYLDGFGDYELAKLFEKRMTEFLHSEALFYGFSNLEAIEEDVKWKNKIEEIKKDIKEVLLKYVEIESSEKVNTRLFKIREDENKEFGLIKEPFNENSGHYSKKGDRIVIETYKTKGL